MNDIRIATYRAPIWGSKMTGTAQIRKDSQARYFVDNVDVVDVRAVDLFTVLACADGTTHYVLTAFLQQVDRQKGGE